MLRTKSDYHVFDVSNVDITGRVIPQIEVNGGTPKVLRLEDIAFLNEAYYQRHSYDSGKYTLSNILRKIDIDNLCSQVRQMAGTSSTHKPNLGGLWITYIGSGVTVPSGVIMGQAGQGAAWMKQHAQGVFDLKTEGFTPDSEIKTDALRRLYHDIGEFKYGSYDFSYSSENHKRLISGSWSAVNHDMDEEESFSGTVTNMVEGTAISRFGGAYPTYAEYHEWTYHGRYFDNVSIDKFTPSQYRFAVNLKNISEMWVVIDYVAEGLENGRFLSQNGHRFLKCTKLSTQESGFLTNWSIPTNVFTEQELKNALTTLGIPLPHTTSDSDRDSWAKVYCAIRGQVLFRIDSNLFTAEVGSLGWQF